MFSLSREEENKTIENTMQFIESHLGYYRLLLIILIQYIYGEAYPSFLFLGPPLPDDVQIIPFIEEIKFYIYLLSRFVIACVTLYYIYWTADSLLFLLL